MLEYPPRPCCVDDTPYTACCTTPYTVDADGRIRPGLGGVIVIVQLPARDALAATVGAPIAVPLAAAPAPDVVHPVVPRARSKR